MVEWKQKRSYLGSKLAYLTTNKFWKKTNLPTFLTLFYSKILFAFFNYGKLYTLLSIVIEAKQWVKLWDPFLHKRWFTCHKRIMIVTEINPSCPMLTGARFASTSKVWNLLQFLNGLSYGIKNYGTKVTFSGMTYLPNYITCSSCFKIISGRHTDR
jgi:hypothetical protein